MININKELLQQVTAGARKAERLRMNHNFHYGPDDLMQRMLNAMEPGTYIRPHKHENPDKREAFFVLRGRLCIIEFSETGDITAHTILNAAEGNYGVEIAECTYHSIVSLESGSVAYEVKDGPYDLANDKNFASWAPEEGSAEAEIYLQYLIEILGLKVG